MQELIKIKQLPIIEENLKNLSTDIDKKVENAKSLICTDENIKVIKQVRANLNKEFKEIEVKRKRIKEKILTPYKRFEEIYKECVSDKYKNADSELKKKIDSIENEIKAKKEKEIKDYFEEYKMANNIDFISYEQANINVTLSVSKKSLKEQVKQFIDKTVNDLELIETQEDKAEILVEYKQSLNVSNAIQTVANRYKALEEEKKKQEEIVQRNLKKEKENIKEAIKPFEEANQLEAPEEQEEILTLRFTVKASRTKLKALKEFLENGGYDYE